MDISKTTKVEKFAHSFLFIPKSGMIRKSQAQITHFTLLPNDTIFSYPSRLSTALSHMRKFWEWWGSSEYEEEVLRMKRKTKNVREKRDYVCHKFEPVTRKSETQKPHFLRMIFWSFFTCSHQQNFWISAGLNLFVKTTKTGKLLVILKSSQKFLDSFVYFLFYKSKNFGDDLSIMFFSFVIQKSFRALKISLYLKSEDRKWTRTREWKHWSDNERRR